MNEDLTVFNELYKPKIIIDETIEFSGITSHYNGVCMFINRNRLFTAFKEYCKENCIHYDFIVVYRCDILTLYPIDFTSFSSDDDILYIPNINHSGGLNDFLAIGTMNSIEKYCNLILYYDKILSITDRRDSNETILYNYLTRIEPIKIAFFPFRCVLRSHIRENGGEVRYISDEDRNSLLL